MEYDINREQVRVMRKATTFDDKDILEIGCGDGKISPHLAEDSRSYTAIDPDGSSIERARAIRQPRTPVVLFKTGSGQALDFPDESLDLVLFTLSLHHQESMPALREAERVLRPDGRVLVVEPRADSDFQQFFHLFDDETEALEKAMEATLSGPFIPEDQNDFTVEAVFDDIADLCAYDFDRDNACEGDDIKIIDLLRETKKSAIQENEKIVIQDRLNIFILRKP
ncbi:MAG: class I SAM-dependent methyltransferase [Desulfobacterales bacterium]|nr:class I SAM-dependent methyltransferase [Desulfobacterales bacterium]